MAPTNITRVTERPGRERPVRAQRAAPRIVLIRAGKVAVRARLGSSPTADRIWAALPLHSTIETWGGAVHFELPLACGRERGAGPTVAKGEIAFWSGEDRVVIVFGPTPISGAGELRLPAPSNIWAVALVDVVAFSRVRAGTEVSIARLDPGSAAPGER